MLQKPLVLGIETSCDESSLSLLDIERRIFVAELTHTQSYMHEKFGGVVPDLASKLHLGLIAKMLEELDLKIPGWQKNVGLICAATRPGLVTSLLVGATFGRSLAAFLSVPFEGVDHCEAHLFSSLLPESGPISLDLEDMRVDLPAAALVLSGGHSFWIQVDDTFQTKCMGATRDDAIGECFDKVAQMLDLGYPGGPWVEKRAALGNPARFSFPVPMPHGLDFSFSGLKTAVRLEISRHSNPLDETLKNDICASLHHTLERLLQKKIHNCINSQNPRSIWLSGGVSANNRIRSLVKNICIQKSLNYRLVPRKYAGDNGSMIAYWGFLKYKRSLGKEEPATSSSQVSPSSVFFGYH